MSFEIKNENQISMHIGKLYIKTTPCNNAAYCYNLKLESEKSSSLHNNLINILSCDYCQQKQRYTAHKKNLTSLIFYMKSCVFLQHSGCEKSKLRSSLINFNTNAEVDTIVFVYCIFQLTSLVQSSIWLVIFIIFSYQKNWKIF